MAFPENDFQEVMNELKVEFKELAE